MYSRQQHCKAELLLTIIMIMDLCDTIITLSILLSNTIMYSFLNNYLTDAIAQNLEIWLIFYSLLLKYLINIYSLSPW